MAQGRRERWTLLVSVLGMVLGVACSGPAQATATPFQGPSPTASRFQGTPSATAFSSPPTATPSPTATTAPTPSPTATPAPGPLGLLPPAPDMDLYDLASRLLGLDVLPTPPPSPTPEVGQQRTFWALDLATREAFSLSATLRLRSAHAAFYVQDDLPWDLEALGLSARALEEEIIPRVGALVGERWLPEQMTLLHGDFPQVAGYYSYTDEYPSALYRYSNEQTILYINAGALPIGSRAYLTTLAHELQHAAHWRADPTEETWTNEGLSEVAAVAAGYDASFISSFLAHPDTSLIYWPSLEEGPQADYGAATLFLTYLREHYLDGGSMETLASEPQDGVPGVQAVLDTVAPGVSFSDLFQEWAVANYLDGRLRPDLYSHLEIGVLPGETITGSASLSAEVNQYAADYIEVRLEGGGARLSFQGQSTTPLLPVSADKGRALWWSNRGDAIDSTLTRAFDLRGVEHATLEMDLWFDIERFWDYAYVEVSVDGGRRWTVLEGVHTSPENPVGQGMGPGYTGRSGDGTKAAWVRESVDLSAFAGEQVLLRLEYVTDGAVSLDGLAVGRIGLPETGYLWEGDGDGGWASDGFVLTPNAVVQDYWVQVIQLLAGGEVRVSELPLDATLAGETTLEGFGARLEAAVLVVMAAAPGTTQPAPYTITVAATPQ